MEDNENGLGAQRIRGETEQGFIPGLPNDIVREHIGTKIPWSAMLALTKVNREWRKAIRSREIHDLRKRCGAAKSRVVVPVSNTTHNGFYDMEGRGTFLFPFPPPAPEPSKVYSDMEYFNWDVEENGTVCDQKPEVRTSNFVYTIGGVVFLDEKLYAIRQSGGNMEDILVLDIGACESGWKFCTRWEMCTNSVTKPFKTSVKNCPTELWEACNGKIYSFHTCKESLHGRVFDPQSYQWMEIEERPVNVCNSAHYYPRLTSEENKLSTLRGHGFADRTAVFNKEVYVAWTWSKQIMISDSVTEKWRFVRNTLIRRIESYICFNMLVINEKLYYFSQCVSIYDPQSNSWTFSQPTFHEQFQSSGVVAAVASYGNELLAILVSERMSSLNCDTDYGANPTRRFCKSVGFGVEGQTLTWEDVPDFPFMNCIYDTASFQLGCLEL